MHPKALLDICAELVQLALKFDSPTDAMLARFFRQHKGLGPRERATISETLYAVLRYKNLFEHFAPSGSGAKARRLAILGFHGAREFLAGAVSAQELDWFDQCQRIKPADLLERQRHNLPEWLVPLLKQQLGDEFWPLIESLNHSAALDLRVNTLKAKRATVQQELNAVGIKAQPTPYSPWGLRLADKPALHQQPVFLRGDVEIQDEGSQLLALLLGAKRGEMVVDFCAGAGGKTLAIGAAMRNSGRLYAFDTSAHRLSAFKARLARSGLSNVYPAAIAHERDERIKRLAGKIDRVLVDAPCSGLGTLRRNPALKWSQNPQTVQAMSAQQSAILQSAARLLKPAGRLVYATCSLLEQENEAIAAAFSQANPNFVPLDAGALLAQLKIEPVSDLCSGGTNGQRFLRLWPQRCQTDGFFAAVWQRQ